MKKVLLLISSISFLLVSYSQAVRTSIASGLGTNPFVWDCTCLPLPNDSIIINHDIILNVDFGFTDGAVVINSSGSLVGDTPNRNFAFSGSANFVNNGVFDVARVAFFGGSAINGGTFTADSFYTAITTVPGWVSNGDMNITYSYWNTGRFNIGPSGQLIVGDNFYNGDSLITGVNAVLVNDGAIRINSDFANSDTIRGVGQICNYGSSLNLGVVTGTLDVCDVSGGVAFDLNLGTIGGSVTTCTSPCNIGITEYHNLTVQVYPNPASGFIQIKSEQSTDLMIFDLLGKLVYQSSASNQLHTISIGEWPVGVYTYRVIDDGGLATGKFMKE